MCRSDDEKVANSYFVFLIPIVINNNKRQLIVLWYLIRIYVAPPDPLWPEFGGEQKASGERGGLGPGDPTAPLSPTLPAWDDRLSTLLGSWLLPHNKITQTSTLAIMSPLSDSVLPSSLL